MEYKKKCQQEDVDQKGNESENKRVREEKV